MQEVQEGSAAELVRIAIVKSSEEYRFFRYCIKGVKVAKTRSCCKVRLRICWSAPRF